MKTLWKILLASGGILVSLSVAQTAPYVLKTFDLTQLDARPEQVLVSPDVLTLLEFDEQIGEVSTGRPEAMTIEVNGNMIRLRANWTAGTTDLVVSVGNRTAMFTIEIDAEGEHTRRYVIKKPEPPVPTSQTTTRNVASLMPGGLVPMDDEAIPLPEWLSVSFNVLSNPNDELVIQYGIKNLGEHPIANDPLRLKLFQYGYQVPFRLESTLR